MGARSEQDDAADEVSAIAMAWMSFVVIGRAKAKQCGVSQRQGEAWRCFVVQRHCGVTFCAGKVKYCEEKQRFGEGNAKVL